jgi:hypothetical protein
VITHGCAEFQKAQVAFTERRLQQFASAPARISSTG